MSDNDINLNYNEDFITIGNLLQQKKNYLLVGEKNDEIENELNLSEKKSYVENIIVKNNMEELQKKFNMSSVSFINDCQVGWNILNDNKLGDYNIALKLKDVTGSKFVIIQVLKKYDEEKYIFVERWGEINFEGKPILNNGTLLNGNKTAMINSFCSKFTDITGYQYTGHTNDTIDTNVLINLYLNNEIKNDLNFNNISNDFPKSKLHTTVRKIVDTLFDTKNMTKILKEMNLNLKEMPLINLSKERITSGYECLQNIEISIITQDKNALLTAIDIYYHTIPRCFGKNKKVKLIETLDKLEKETEFLDTLWEIQTIMEVIKNEKFKTMNNKKHPIDSLYEKLKCEIEVVPSNNSTRKTIIELLKSDQLFMETPVKFNIKNIFEIKNKDEKNEMLSQKIFNKKILWYGSKITNWYNIFSQGLRILPKDSVANVSVFDKGIYITDISLKSTNNTFHRNSSKTEFFGLIEAIIGTSSIDDQSSRNLSKIGSENEHCKENEENIINNEELLRDSTINKQENLVLYPNKYIIYNKDQVRFRYIIELEIL